MRNQITFAAGIAVIALLTACTKERLEPMTAVQEARAQTTAATMPLRTVDKHAQNDRIITDATIIDRTAERATGPQRHDIALAPSADRTSPDAAGSHARVITFFAGDRANGPASHSSGRRGVLVLKPDAAVGGVCSYCWQTGLAANPEEMPVRLLENDDPVPPAPTDPRGHISGESLPAHADWPTTVIGPIVRQIPESEATPAPTVSGPIPAVTISDDNGNDE